VAFYSHTAKLGGIQLLDLTDPSSPAVVGAFETGDSGVGVQVAGGFAYVPFLNPYTFIGGLHIVDITHPSAPLRVGTFYTLADPLSGLLVIDASEPDHPRLLGRTRTSDSASAVAVAGRYAYVADGTSGLQVIDVSDPARPRVVGSQGLFGNSGYFVSVALTGN